MGRQSGPGICAVAPLCLAAVAMGDLDPDSLERALVLNPSLFFCASLLSRSVDTVDWGDIWLFATFNTGLRKNATVKIDFVKMPSSSCALRLTCHFYFSHCFYFLFFIF